MKPENEFFRDFESICFDCGRKPQFVIHPGVSLCIKCWILDKIDKILRKYDALLNRNH